MFELVYIKSEDREKLRLLREERDRTPVQDKNYKKLQDKITKIEATRKSLRDCTMEEVIDFRKFVHDKAMKAGRSGKLNHATMLKRQLVQIEAQMRTIYMRTTMEQEAEQKRLEEQKKQQKDASTRPTKRKPRKIQNQWTVDLGDLD